MNEKDLRKISYNEILLAAAKYENNYELQSKYANLYLSKARLEKNNTTIVKGFFMLALINEKDVAIKYLDSTIKYSKKIGDLKFSMMSYYQKAITLDNMRRFKEAISNYILTEEYAKKSNDLDYYYQAKLAIAIIKSEDMGETEEALVLFRQCYKFYKKDIDNYKDEYLKLIFSVADSYKTMQVLDSTSYYNVLGYKESKRLENEKMNSLFILNEGANQVLKKNYLASIDSIKKAFPLIKKNDDIGNILASYYYLGKSYQGLNDAKRAVENYAKVDSIYRLREYITPEFVDGYYYLIDYHKKNNDDKKQLFYLNSLISIDSVFQVNYKQLSKKLKNDYDIPHLIQEKETIIKGLHNDKKANYWIIGILGLTVVLSLVIMQHLTNQKKQYKQRFETLMQQNKTESLNAEVEEKEEESTDLGIPEDVVVAILKQLTVFENKKQYLKPNITISDLATTFETNSKYVSIVINAKKQKSFSNYINDLRIDHAVAELKNNKEMRKYTIAAIAEEVGFNTSESFSKAFFKRTGIKPSYFMKELSLS